MRTYLSDGIESAGIYAQYDGHVKRLLKDRNVLACILTGTVKEFQGYSMKEAADCIEKEMMEERYGLPMSAEMESEVSDMCNLSYGIAEAAAAEAREKARAEVTAEMVAKYEKILEKTVAEKENAIAENTINILASLVRDHLLDVPEAAKRAGLSVSEFNKRMGH